MLHMNPRFSILVLAVCAWFATAVQGADLGTRHIGTWKLVSTKYGEAKEHTPYPASSMRMKIINPTHFTWLEISDGKVQTSAGGKFVVSGDSYTETIDFAGEGMEPYRGKAQKFTLRIEGDKLYQSGDLSDGLHIEEVWERVK